MDIKKDDIHKKTLYKNVTNTGTWTGKRLRGKLLVLLKDKAGLKYKEISEMGIFSNLSFTSLSDLYRRTKKDLRKGGRDY